MTADAEVTYAAELIKCVRLDAKASRLLHGAGLHAAGTYHLCQAAEKAIKAYLLLGERMGLTLSDMKSHDFLAILKHSLEKTQKEVIDGREADVTRLGEHIRRLNEIKHKCALLAKDDFEQLISNYGEIKVEDLPGGIMAEIEPEDFTNRMTMYGFLTLLGLIARTHDQSTRYPDCTLEPWDYDLNLGIVAAAPDLLGVIEVFCTWLDEGF
ncbi:MAG: hypothetical protein NT137_03680 [Methanomassiliicoccales archaeon]|nr:hypothetical protein [Methanomassiliicoccales archaeon]